MRDFNDFGAFAQHLAAVAQRIEAAEHPALEKAAVMVEKRAKDKIGHYQDKAGPFAAWAPLAESTKQDRVRKGFNPDDPLLRTGKLRDSIKHHVDGHEACIGSDEDIAVWQEFGTHKIPPRSFLGGATAELEKHIVDELGEQTLRPLVRS